MTRRVSKKGWAQREEARRAEEAAFTAAIGQLRCPHPAKKSCGLCGERFCPNDGCDPNHMTACRDAMKP